MTNLSLPDLVKRAEKAYSSEKFSQAAGYFLQAKAMSVELGEPLKAAEIANNASVALLRAGDAQGALEVVEGTDHVFAQSGNLRGQAIALGNRAAALEALNRFEEALTCYRNCNDLLKQAGDEETRSYVLKSISALQIRTGHQLEALASMDAALQNKKQLSFQERFLKKLIQIPFQILRRGG